MQAERSAVEAKRRRRRRAADRRLAWRQYIERLRKSGCATRSAGSTVVYRYTEHRSTMPKRKLDPLPSAAFQILLSLAEEDLHGYAIMRNVAEQTDGRMRLGPGTLYSSIQTLLEQGCIEEVAPREDPSLGQERRRYYRLTTAGRKLARSEAERLGDLL